MIREIGRTGSLTGASQALNIAQPALSAQLKEIEASFGIELFHRHARGMRPTSAGRVLIEHADRILSATEQAEADLLRRSRNPGGRVRLGLPYSIAALCLGSLLETLETRHREISLVFTEGFSGTLAEHLVESRLDLAILVGDPGDPRISTRPIARERMALVAPRSAEIAARQSVSLAEVSALPLLLPTRVHGIRRLIDAHATTNGWTLNLRHEVDSAFQLVDLVMRGFGMTVLTPSSISFGQGREKITSIPIVDPDVWRHLTLAWPVDRPPDSLVGVVERGLLETMQHHLRPLGEAVDWDELSQDIQ